MGIFEALVIFIVVWWLCLFVVLPIGVRGQFEDNSTVIGTEEGAPKQAMMGKKLIWATLAAVPITLLVRFGIGLLLAPG